MPLCTTPCALSVTEARETESSAITITARCTRGCSTGNSGRTRGIPPAVTAQAQLEFAPYLGSYRPTSIIGIGDGSFPSTRWQGVRYRLNASVPPNGSRLSCGRPARRRKGVGRSPWPRQGHNTPLPLERSPPVSFKRLLGARIWSRGALGFQTRRCEHASGVTKHPITALERRRRRLPPSLKSSVE